MYNPLEQSRGLKPDLPNSRILRGYFKTLFPKDSSQKEHSLRVVVDDEAFSLFFRSFNGRDKNRTIAHVGLNSDDVSLGFLKVPNLQLILSPGEVALTEYRFTREKNSVKVVPLVATRIGFEGRGFGVGLLTSIDDVVNYMIQIYPQEIGHNHVYAEVEDSSQGWGLGKARMGWTGAVFDQMDGFKRCSFLRGQTKWKKDYQ